VIEAPAGRALHRHGHALQPGRLRDPPPPRDRPPRRDAPDL